MPGSPTAPSTVADVLPDGAGEPPDVDDRPESGGVPELDGTVICVGEVTVGVGATTVPVRPGTGTPCG